MRLELGSFQISDVILGEKTHLDGTILVINEDELRKLALADSIFKHARVEIVKPGESARIIHLLDTVEPRVKVLGYGNTFPGFLGNVETVGSGRTHRLQGIAVMEAAEVPWRERGGLHIVREGIVDMAGPGAACSPFASTINIVLVLDLAPDCSDEEYDHAIRLAGIKVADHLARTTVDLEPPRIDVFDISGVNRALPNVVYICQVQSQGVYAATFLYGKACDVLFPVLLDPNEILDGAIVNGNHIYQSLKIPTWLHCNNPVIERLYRGHGSDWNFVGVILSRGHHYGSAEKERSASMVAKLAQMLDANGAILTWEGGGNSIMEAMLTVEACERIGIKTSVIAYEFGGKEGDQAPLLYSVPEADGIVSAGSIDYGVELDPLERVVGGSRIRLKPEVGGVFMPVDEHLSLEMNTDMYCGANQVGFGHIYCVDF